MTDVSVNVARTEVTIPHRLSLGLRARTRGITTITPRVQLRTVPYCRKLYLVDACIEYCWKYWLNWLSWRSSVVQLLLKPDIKSHPLQLPLRPNVQALRYLNFGQFRTPSNFSNCHPWDFCLLTRGHFVLSEKTCAVRLRPKSEKRMVGGCICPGGEKTQNTSST